MRGNVKTIVGVAAIAVACAAGVAIGRQLGAKEAREQIAALVGGSPSDVRIKSIAPGPLGGAIVEAEVGLAFRMVDDKGTWRVEEVRLGDNRWERLDLLRAALDAEKARVAATDLRALAGGVEAYRGERGFLPETDSIAGLVDRIAPRFMNRIVRVDPWHNEYYYEATGASYRVGSTGPDGARGNGDDVVVTTDRGGQ